MTTGHVERLFAFYEEDLLPPDRRAAVAEHLAACDRCRARLAAVREAEQAVAALDGPAPVPDLLPAVLERIDRAGAGRRPRRLALGGAAAALLLAVVLTLAYPPARAHVAALFRSAAGVVAYMRAVVTGDRDGEQGRAAAPHPPQVAFVGTDGGVWLADADGSQRTRLLDGCGLPPHGREDRPTNGLQWSPTGEMLACLENGAWHVWTVRADGTGARRLLEDCYGLTWSPDGRRLACGGEQGIRVAEVTTGTVTQVGEGTATNIAWSATGSYLAYARSTGGLHVARADGRTVADLVDAIATTTSTFAWSQTGSKLAYATQEGVTVYDAPSGQRQTWDLPENVRVQGLAWVMEDSALLLSLVESGTGPLRFRAVLLDTATGGWTPLPDHAGVMHAVAPDGQKVAYIAPVSGSGSEPDVPDAATASVMIVDLVTGQSRRVTDVPVSPGPAPTPVLAFSSDGARLCWRLFGPPGGIWCGNVDGSGWRAVQAPIQSLEAPGSSALAPDPWLGLSPDFGRVAYFLPAMTAASGAAADLWVARTNGADAVRIGPARPPALAWRPGTVQDEAGAGAPAAAATPRPPAPCPIDTEACDFAAQVSRWVLSGNADAIIEATTPEAFRCPQPGPAIGGEFLPCGNAIPGEQRFGYTLHVLGSHGYVAGREEYRTRLLSSLVGVAGQPPPPEFRPATLGCPLEGSGIPCRDAFALVFARRAPAPAPGREGTDRSFLIFLARRDPDGRLTLAPSTVFAGPIPNEDGRVLADGGTIAPPYLEDPVPFGTFHPWNPPETNPASQRPVPSQSSPADQLEEGLVRSLESMHYHLRMATGEGVACDYRCLPGGSFQNLIGTVRQQDCAKGEPTGVLRSEAYDEARHGELAGAYVAACRLILEPPAAAGPPADSPEWRAVANQAEALVWEVLRRTAALVVSTGDCLNVRSGPSITAEVRECLIEGALVRHSGKLAKNEDRTWLRVRTPNGIEGWASTEYLLY